MIIKNQSTSKSILTEFELLGENELALSRSFAYLLSKEKQCLFKFLRFLGIRINNTESNFYDTVIEVEKYRKESSGRTDIEIVIQDKVHVIIECKIRKGRIKEQRTKYLRSFDKNAKNQVMCFLTQELDTNIELQDDVKRFNTSWNEIIELFNNKKLLNEGIVKKFLSFTLKNYKMKEIKEILVQDVKGEEITRYEKCNVYRRDETFGTPLYFAPHYTKESKERWGVNTISKILGILTISNSEVGDFRPNLKTFTSNDSLIDKWITGVKMDSNSDMGEEKYTYYFLDNPYFFKSPLRKDKGIEEGRGKDWIAAFISPNRSVSFIDLLKHIPELRDNDD